jgi:hypothetical protein
VCHSASESTVDRLRTRDPPRYFHQDFYDFSDRHGETGAKGTPLVETFIALACCSLSERGFNRVNDSRGCSLKRGVTRRSGLAKTFSLRLWRVRQAGAKGGGAFNVAQHRAQELS